jgi:hypothetical protein
MPYGLKNATREVVDCKRYKTSGKYSPVKGHTSSAHRTYKYSIGVIWATSTTVGEKMSSSIAVTKSTYTLKNLRRFLERSPGASDGTGSATSLLEL